MTKALLSVGSNWDDRWGYLKRAVEELGDNVMAVSKIYETPPWPPGDPAPKYLNAAVLVENKEIDAYGWLRRIHEIEQPTTERRRDPSWQFPARTLDMDIIMLWDDKGQPIISDDPTLILPHPRAHMRAFVLQPWHDIQPSGQLPGHGAIAELLKAEAIAKDLARMKLFSV